MDSSPTKSGFPKKRDYQTTWATLSKHSAHAKIMFKSQSELRDLLNVAFANSMSWILQSKEVKTYHRTWGWNERWETDQAFREASFWVEILKQCYKGGYSNGGPGKSESLSIQNTASIQSKKELLSSKAMRTSERSVCYFGKICGKQLPQSLLDEVQDNFKYIFNKELTRSTQWKIAAFWLMKAELEKIYASFERIANTFYGKAYPFPVMFFHQLRRKAGKTPKNCPGSQKAFSKD